MPGNPGCLALCLKPYAKTNIWPKKKKKKEKTPKNQIAQHSQYQAGGVVTNLVGFHLPSVMPQRDGFLNCAYFHSVLERLGKKITASASMTRQTQCFQ